MTGIYMLTSPSGKNYIGQSTNINQRMSQHKRMIKKAENNNSKLGNAIRKYGFENFKREILVECKIEELDDYEIYFIEKYNSIEIGYNSRMGGKVNHKLTEEHKNKLSIAFKGVYNGRQNKPFYIDDILYNSVGEASTKLGIAAKTIHNRLNSPNHKYKSYLYLNKEKTINQSPLQKTRALACVCDEKEYKSLSDAADSLNMSLRTLIRRMNDPNYTNYYLV